MRSAAGCPIAMVSLATSLPLAAFAAEPVAMPEDADIAIHGSFNNGEDITRPRNLFQVRQRYERLPDAKGREPEKWTTTLRADLWTGRLERCSDR